MNRPKRKLLWIRFKNRVRSGYKAQNDPNFLQIAPGIYNEPIYLKNGIDLRSIYGND